MPWLISGLITGGAFLFRKFAWKRLFGAAAATAVAAAPLVGSVAGPAATAYVGSKVAEKFPWWIIAILAPVLGFVYFVFFRKPAAKKEDVDFYAGALGLDPAEAAKCSKQYLAGKLSKQRRDEKWANNPEVAGLKAKGITMQFGQAWSGGGNYRGT